MDVRSWIPVVTLAICLPVLGSRTDYLSAKHKFQAIEKHQYRPGTRVSLSPAELNSYVQAELPLVAPAGVRSPSVQLLGNNQATGTILVDFLKLQSTRGKAPGFLLRTLLEGEHEVAVTAQVRSSRGMATVDLQRIEVSGIPIEGQALDFLIRNYLIPNYPDAKIGRPFKLESSVDRIEVTPGAAFVQLR